MGSAMVNYNFSTPNKDMTMKFTIDHFNINVLDLEKSLIFYEKALGLKEERRSAAEDGSYIIIFLGDGITTNKLELTWLKSQEKPYNLGDEEFHIAFRTQDFDEAYALHKKMDCICYENKEMGIYFINDPDGYWLEVVPVR
jgi:lactoylglutathione lyase